MTQALPARKNTMASSSSILSGWNIPLREEVREDARKTVAAHCADDAPLINEILGL